MLRAFPFYSSSSKYELHSPKDKKVTEASLTEWASDARKDTEQDKLCTNALFDPSSSFFFFFDNNYDTYYNYT